jgi:hypothetical protein
MSLELRRDEKSREINLEVIVCRYYLKLDNITKVKNQSEKQKWYFNSRDLCWGTSNTSVRDRKEKNVNIRIP